MKYTKKIGSRKIDAIEILQGPSLHFLVLLTNGTITLYHPANLKAIDTVPLQNVSKFCCNSGTPFCGLAVISGTTLHLYNLQYGFSYSKVRIDDALIQYIQY